MSKVTNSSQVKISLPIELHGYLKSKADKFGLTMSSYIKNLIIDDVKNVEIPTFKMSKSREIIAVKALKDFDENKIRDIDDIDDYLNSL